MDFQDAGAAAESQAEALSLHALTKREQETLFVTIAASVLLLGALGGLAMAVFL